MNKYSVAFALCIGAGAAFAQPPAPTQSAQGDNTQQGQPQIMHAALVVTGTQPLRAAAQPSAQAAAKAKGDEDEQNRNAAAMLLAAVALMTGIALRRWGTGAQ